MTLLALQRDFQRWLMQEPVDLPGAFDESHRGGLAVYLNNYRSQLLACLHASFPALRLLIGEAAFDAAAARFIDDSPPRSWTLDAYAEGFPEALRLLLPQTPHCSELAQLELALASAFVAADAGTIEPARLADVDWDSALLHFVPTLVLLPVTCNVGEIWSAITAGKAPPPVLRWAEPKFLAIWRSGFESKFRVASADESAVLEQICRGVPFGRICADLVGTLGEERGTAAAGAMLGQWLADEMIAAISQPQS
jgi:hypothetical protein